MNATLSRIFDASRETWRACSIRDIVARYVPVVEEFLAYNEDAFEREHAFRDVVDKLVLELSRAYDFQLDVLFVKTSTYTTDLWGNLFWSFVHLSAILITHAFNANLIGDILDFPTIVYNIDAILPCSMCAEHYRAIKNTTPVRACVKQMSFGYVISGAMNFHNIVTANIDKMQRANAFPRTHPFGTIDHARVYGCIELQQRELTKTRTYARNSVAWQPRDHRLIATLASIGSQPLRSFVETTALLESAYSDKRDARDDIILSLERALTFRVNDKVIDDNKQLYRSTLSEFYSAHASAVERLLLDLRDGNAEETWYVRSVDAFTKIVGRELTEANCDKK